MSPINDLNASAELGQMLPTRVLTRGGAQLDPRLDVWEWTDGVFKLRIDFSYYKGLRTSRAVAKAGTRSVPERPLLITCGQP